jgi:hypothetical protein
LVLGQGTWGTVLAGTFDNENVAVKVLNFTEKEITNGLWEQETKTTDCMSEQFIGPHCYCHVLVPTVNIKAIKLHLNEKIEYVGFIVMARFQFNIKHFGRSDLFQQLNYDDKERVKHEILTSVEKLLNKCKDVDRPFVDLWSENVMINFPSLKICLIDFCGYARLDQCELMKKKWNLFVNFVNHLECKDYVEYP